MTRFGSIARGLVAAEFVVAVAVIVYAGFHDVPDVFVGAPEGLPVRFSAGCQPVDAESGCHATVTEISRGRFRIASDASTPALTIAVEQGEPTTGIRYVLVGTARPADVQVRAASAAIDPMTSGAEARRSVITVPAGAAVERITVTSTGSAAAMPLVVTEFGFFSQRQGLVSDARPFFDAIPPLRYHTTLVPRAVTKLCLLTIVAAFFVPRTWLRRATPFALALICFSLSLLDLEVLYSPYAGHDLRSYYASGPLQEGPGSNLNGEIWEGFRFLHGQGFTVAEGLVTWAKMPGYGFFAALAGLLFGHATLLQVVMGTVFLQIVCYAVAVGFFAWAAAKLWTPPVVWAATLLVTMVPKQLGYTQVDSVIAPIGLTTLGILCLRLAALEERRPISWRADAALHASLALWFFMRPDILPAWIVLSLALHVRQPRRLVLPAALAILIGATWGAYKMRYTGEFAPTTSTTGASLVCGLWEVPSRFPWVCSDESYFAWVTSHTPYEPKSNAGSNVVTREVLKFWVIFPGHFVLMVYNKMLRCLSGDLWPGIPTDLQQSIFQVVNRARLALLFLATVVVALVVGYQRRRTLMLSWPLFLNAPVFWFMQTSEGRYYGAVGVALLVAAVPLLLDGEFYATIFRRKTMAAAAITGMAMVAIAAWPVHDWLLRNEAFHYWTPFLDASHSSWGILR